MKNFGTDGDLVRSRTNVTQPKRLLLWGTKWTSIHVGVNFSLKILRGLVVPYFLAPDGYGLWASVGVLLGYLQFTDLGVRSQLAKQLPGLLAQHGEKAYWEKAGLGISWTLCTSTLLAVGFLIASQLYAGDAQDFYPKAFAILALAVLLRGLRALCSELLNAREEYGATAMQGILTDSAGFLAAIIGVIEFGALGLVVSIVVGEVVGLLYCLSRLIAVGMRRITLHLKGLSTTIRGGLVLLVVTLLEVAMMTADQVFLIRSYEKTVYGLYAFGLFIVSTLIAVSAIFVTHQPRILALAASGHQVESASLAQANLSLYMIFVAICIPFILLLIDLVLQFYLKDYRAGLTLYTLMPIMALARGPTVLLRGFFVAYHRERDLIRWQAMGLGTIIILNLVIVAFHGRPELFVLSTAVGYGISGWFMARAFQKYKKNVGKIWLLMASLVGLTISVFGLYQIRSFYFVVGETTLLTSFAIFGLAIIAFSSLLFWSRKSWLPAVDLYLEGADFLILRRLRRQTEGVG